MNDIERWKETARENKSQYIISVCDTFDHSDYPVYCKDKEDMEKQKPQYDGVNMQRINEVICMEELIK